MKSLKKKAGKMSFTNKKTSYARGNNFLHGQLLIKIISAENLPDLEGIFRVSIESYNYQQLQRAKANLTVLNNTYLYFKKSTIFIQSL